MLTVMVKLAVTAVYEVNWYIIVSVCVPSVYGSLEEKVRMGAPELVETVT